MANFEDLILRDTRANQPAAGIAGRLYFVTDEEKIERDNGAAWQQYSPTPGTAYDSDIVFSDTTAGNADSDQHGFLPKLSGDSDTWLDGKGAWTTPATSSSTALASDKKVRTAGNYTTTSTTFVDVDNTNMSITLTTGARRCMIVVSGSGYHSDTNHWAFDIDIDGSRQGQAFGLVFGGDVTTQNQSRSFTYITDVLSAASHTFKLQWRVDGGTATLYANTTNTPLIFSVVELPLKDPS